MDRLRYYPITRQRNILTQDYITQQVENGACGFDTYAEARHYLFHCMDTDDSDYEVCVRIGGVWCAPRNAAMTEMRTIR